MHCCVHVKALRKRKAVEGMGPRRQKGSARRVVEPKWNVQTHREQSTCRNMAKILACSGPCFHPCACSNIPRTPQKSWATAEEFSLPSVFWVKRHLRQASQWILVLSNLKREDQILDTDQIHHFSWHLLSLVVLDFSSIYSKRTGKCTILVLPCFPF